MKIQDAVNALVFAITKHFVGDPADYRESAYDSLENLKCFTLSISSNFIFIILLICAWVSL